MKNPLSPLTLALALACAACADHSEFSKSDLDTQTAPALATAGQVQFEPTLTATATRADDGGTYYGGTLYTSTLRDARFGVFAYNTGSADYASNAFQADFMYNQRIYHDDGTDMTNHKPAWAYTPVKYWPNGIDKANAFEDPSNTATEAAIQKLSFFAYAPWAKNILKTEKTGTYADQNTIDPTSAYAPTDYVYGDKPATVDNALKTVNYANAHNDGGVVGMTNWNDKVDPWVNYVMRDGYNGTTTRVGASETDFTGVDLLWGLRGQYSYDETDDEDNNLHRDDPHYLLGRDYNVNLTRQSVDEKVRFMFKHALAKIGGSAKDESITADGKPRQSGFKVVLDIDVNSTKPGIGTDNQQRYFPEPFNNLKTLVTLQAVKVRDAWSYAQEPGTTLDKTTTKSNLNTYGWFNIATGQWSNSGRWAETTANGGAQGAKVILDIDNTATGANINSDICENGIGTTKVIDTGDGKPWQWNTAQPTGVTTNPKPVYANEDNPGLIIIPGETPQTLYITVDYFVRTADPQLSRGFSQVEQIITNKVDLTGLEANKYYTIVIHLGLTSVKFEAIVVDWAMNSGDLYNEAGEIVPDPAAVENDASVWLPSNVVNTTSINAFNGTSHKCVTVDAETTEYKVYMTGLSEGNVVTVSDKEPVHSTVEAPSFGGYTVEYTAGTTKVQSDGRATVTITLKPNTTAAEIENILRIYEKALATDTDINAISTTILTLTQGKKTMP